MNADENQRARIDADLTTPPPGALARDTGADEMALFNQALTGMT